MTTVRWLAAVLLLTGPPASAHRWQAIGDVIQPLQRATDARGPLPVLRSGKWGYIDTTGSVVISPQFEVASFFYEGLSAVRLNGLWGYIDASGKLVIPPRFTTANRFTDGLAHVRWSVNPRRAEGHIDRTGRVVVQCDGERGDGSRLTAGRCGGPFSGGLTREAIEAGHRCVDEPGNPKEYPCKATFIDQWGFYDDTGRLAIVGPFHSGGSQFAEGLAAVARYGDPAVGFIDTAGAFFIPPRFEMARAFAEGMAAVRVGGLWGFIDRAGTTIIEPRFQSATDFSDGLAAARLDGKWGYIDATGRFAVVPQFSDVSNFSEGLAAVCCDGSSTRYVDRTGRWAFEATFPRGIPSAGMFAEGIALVEIAGIGPAYIDRVGRVVAAVETR